MNFIPKTKLSATGIHFLFSAAVFTLFILILRLFWYPEPYFTASGGWQGLKLVAFIDLVLGPLLTFVAFNLNKSKKTLTIDLGIILILQVAALIWGVNTVYSQRPIAITFWENRFYTVTFESVAMKYSPSKKLDYMKDNPRLFYIVPKPTTINDINQLTDKVLEKRLPPFQLIDRYKPIDEYFDSIKIHSIKIEDVILNNPDMKHSLTAIFKDTNTQINDNFYLPLISRYQNIILVFNKNAQLLGSLKAPFKPNN